LNTEVEKIEPGTPAEAAGLKQHDILERLDDQLMINPQQLAALLLSKHPGDEVSLAIVRQGGILVIGPRSAILAIVRPGVTFRRGRRVAKVPAGQEAPGAVHPSGLSASAPDYFDVLFFLPPLRKLMTERRDASSDFRVRCSAVSRALSVWLPAVSRAPAV